MFNWNKVWNRKFFTLALGVSLVGSIVAAPLYADELSDALKEQQKIEQQQQQIESQKKQLTLTTDRIQKELSGLETQIASASDILKKREEEYLKAQNEVAKAEGNLKETEEKMEGRQNALGQRLRGLYEYGQVNYLEVLFESDSLGDFITRMEYLNILVENDKKILTDIKEQKAEIEAQKKELESKRDLTKQMSQEASKAKADLDGKVVKQQNMLDQSKKDLISLAEQSEALEKQNSAVANMIKSLSGSGGVQGTISVWPLTGLYEISSPFGYRIHPITGQKSLHTGVDIPASTGTSIKAAGAGTVIVAGWNDAYGYMTIIDHGGKYSTLYGHQSRLGVSVGDTVKAGQVIGYVGTTGWSTGPHLHFEIRIDGNAVDPLPYYR